MTLPIDVADDPYRDEDEEDLLRPRRRRSFLSAERDLRGRGDRGEQRVGGEGAEGWENGQQGHE